MYMAEIGLTGRDTWHVSRGPRSSPVLSSQNIGPPLATPSVSSRLSTHPQDAALFYAQPSRSDESLAVLDRRH